MDDVDANSISVNSLVDSWDDSTNRDIRGTIVVKKQTAPENYHIFNIIGQVTSASTYSKIAVSYVLTSGTISDADAVFVEFARTGDQGTDAGLTMTFESTQTDTDQGAGKIFFNAAVASATIIYMDDLEQGGGSINDFVDSWDDSTSTVKGHVIMKKQDDLAVWALYSVSGSVTSASTYSKMTCGYIDGTGSFTDADTVTVQFTRTGDKGTTGSTGAASSGFHYQFETATADSDQGAGKIWLNNSTVASASILYIDDDDNDGTDISAFIATWDDSSATSDKGFIKIQSRATATDYAVFKISSSGTDNTAYYEFPVSHLVSAGTLSDTEVVDVFFTRSGDSGGVANRTVDTMTGDASDTTLALSQSPGSTNNCTCFIDGVGQHPGTDFNISGSTLTFTTAPPTGAVVVAICGGNESIGTPSDGTVTLAKMAANSIDSDQYVDGSIDAVHLSANSIDSDSYVDGSIDNAHIADDAIDSEHYADGSIDNAHIADDAIDSEHYAAGSIDTAHIATNQIDETLMKDAFVGDFTDVTVTAADTFLYGDTTDSGNTKKDTVQGILDLAGGAWNLITSVSASGNASLILSGITSTYDTYAILISDMVPASDSVHVYMRLGDSGGIDSGTDYAYHSFHQTSASASYAANPSAGDNVLILGLDVGNASGEGFSGVYYLGKPADGTTRSMVWGNGVLINDSGVTVNAGLIGSHLSVITHDRVEVLFQTGNIATGRMSLYGIAHS